MPSFRLIILFLSLSLLPLVLPAQSVGPAHLFEGVVYNELGEELGNVVIACPELGLWAVSDKEGHFQFELPLGNWDIVLQHLAYKTEHFEIVSGDGSPELRHFLMLQRSLGLNEITVTAVENQQSLTSTTTLGPDAIAHVQANSLTDLFQLLPGQPVKNPDLNRAGQASLRGVGNALDLAVDAFGTAVVLDGIPLSNNGNLQVSNTALIGAQGYFNTVSGGGLDLREIAVDDIERVEIVRGIPSVEYGDLTVGAIMVKTSEGVEPMKATVRSNPVTQQVGLTQGMGLKSGMQTLNVAVDFARSQQDLRISVPRYTRFSGQIKWGTLWLNERMKSNTQFRVFRTKDVDRNDKDALTEERRHSEDYGFQLLSSGQMKGKRHTGNQFDYKFSVAYRQQKSYTKQLKVGEAMPLATATNSGTYEVPFAPSEYYTVTHVDGQPLNLFASLQKRFNLVHPAMRNQVKVGVTWRMDANYGSGKDFDTNYLPPSSYRPRSFSDVPALHQLAFYAENLMTTTLWEKTVKWQAGLRFDNIQPDGLLKGAFGQKLMPRTTISYQLWPNLKLHGGVGLTMKAPSLVYLYPERAYFDARSFLFYSSQYPTEGLALVTTQAIATTNENLKLSTNEKWEAGFDVQGERWSLSTTFYHERLKDAYGFYDWVHAFDYPVYDMFFYLPGAGNQPLLDEVNVGAEVFRGIYKRPGNTREIKRRGVEFAFQSMPFTRLKTRFNLSGSWHMNRAQEQQPQIVRATQYLPGNGEQLIGIYEADAYRDEQFVTTLRIIQHVPLLRFIATLSIQNEWINRSSVVVNGELPSAFIGKDGVVQPILPAEAEENYAFLIRTFDESAYRSVQGPALWNLNLKLAKELGDIMRISFFANNMFMHNPAYVNQRTSLVEKRNPVLYFGGELQLNL